MQPKEKLSITEKLNNLSVSQSGIVNGLLWMDGLVAHYYNLHVVGTLGKIHPIYESTFCVLGLGGHREPSNGPSGMK